MMSTVYCRRVAEGNVDDCERRYEGQDGGVKDFDGSEEEVEFMVGMYVSA